MEEMEDSQKTSKVRNRARVATKTICAASRMLGVKSNDLLKIQPSQFLSIKQNPLPVTADCDVVLAFPPNTPESTLTWLLARIRLRLPQLKILVRHHSHMGVYVFYLTQSFENFLYDVEELKFPKRLKDEYGGGLKEFVMLERHLFVGNEDEETFILTQEKQAIILHQLNSLYAVAGDQLENIKFIEGQAIISKCQTEGIIEGIVALHEYKVVENLKTNWVRAFFSRQPINDICDYFGVKIAMYFAWLGHYTSALILPAIVGIFLFYLSGKNQAMDDLCFVVFAFFNVIWATLYLESWKRSCAVFAYRWGTIDKEDELIVQPRPLFIGQLEKSPVTSKLEPSYPAWKRNLFRYCVTLPVILLCLFIVFIVMFLIFELQVWCDRKVKEMNLPFWLTFFPKILLALAINFMDGVYKKVAHWLNDQENYRLDEAYENHLIIKVVAFQFVNSFLSLFYIAFYLQDMDKLRSQLAALLITRQVVGNIKESLIPFVKERMKFFKMSVSDSSDEKQKNANDLDNNVQSSSHKNLLTQAEAECAKPPYEGTFEDYLEMFIQFGYVILFSSAFPLAGLCALLNNIIEIRSDAFKLCIIHQRPFGERVENIGTWQDAMEVMGVIAVIVNCALIGMSGLVERVFPDITVAGTIMLIIILEHVIVSLKFIIAYAIPDVPQWVATAMAKVEFNRREASKKISPNTSVDEWATLKETSCAKLKETSCASTQTDDSININAISSIGRTYNMNMGPQHTNSCTAVEDSTDAVEPKVNESVDSSEPLPPEDANVPSKKTSKKMIPHLKAIGKSLSLDARTFRSKFRESKHLKGSEPQPSSASPNEKKEKAKSSKFKFPSPERKKQLMTSPDTPPPICDDHDESVNSHSKSKLSKISSFRRRKKVKFNQEAADNS